MPADCNQGFLLELHPHLLRYITPSTGGNDPCDPVAPGIWNNWRGTLVTELYRRAFEFFEKGVFAPEDRAARAARVRARVLAAAPETRRAAIGVFVEQMPDSYFLSTPEEMMLDHGELRRRFEERRVLRGDVDDERRIHGAVGNGGEVRRRVAGLHRADLKRGRIDERDTTAVRVRHPDDVPGPERAGPDVQCHRERQRRVRGEDQVGALTVPL